MSKCIENECKIYSIFNYKNEKTGLYCKKHKKDKMIDIKHNICEENEIFYTI